MSQTSLSLWSSTDLIPLWNPAFGQVPPALIPFLLPGENVRPCVLVFPGGGYTCRCESYEGVEICEALNAAGFHACMVQYRVNPYRHPCMEIDARRAIRTVRYHAKAWHIDPDAIGTLGFSAGGHLVCMTGLRFDAAEPKTDEIDLVSARPDSVCACYAVTMLTGDKVCPTMPENTVGDPADPALCRALSAPLIAREDAPPFYIWHTAEDQLVPVENALLLAGALREKRVPCELHVFPHGGHGLGLAKATPTADQWFGLYVNWLNTCAFK